VTEEKLVLTINSAKEIFINKNKVPVAGLSAKLENIFGQQDR